MAAHEFRETIEKISGARLPIVTAPSGKAAKVFIGASPHNPVTVDGLQHGAYRIASGPDWLALVGDDTDFEPLPPFARSNSDIPRAQAEWEQIVGAPYGMPRTGLYKNRLRLPGEIGKPDGAITEKDETFELWGLDERGSYNAVCGLLHQFGARWYLPGELGEVLPALKTIKVPRVDETVRPDFALRQFNFRFSIVGAETARWVMRLGLRNDERLQIAHGLSTMTNRQAVFDAHPDWFAIYGGKPDFKPGDSKCQLCYSNDELFRETVRWARAMLDTYRLDTVSIMPPDGYTSICQCEKCRGKDSPERNERGLLSDYVWDFVNRVAREIAKSHPRAKVLNCAYGAYTLPPLSIDKLEPNVLVCIVGGRRPINKAGAKGEGESAPDVLRAAWAKKTDNSLLIFENYPFTGRGYYLPAFDAQSLGDTVNATKGLSQGEDIWLTVAQDFDKNGIGFNHFLVYFTARAYWGGDGYDPDAALREYCRLFYGPAEQEMLAFFTYCAANWADMETDRAKTDKALALFDAAKTKAGRAPVLSVPSIYAQRLGLIDDYLKGLGMKSHQLAQKRGPVPIVRLVGDAAGLVIDGKLDDAYWQNCPVAATGRLRELQTGGTTVFDTTFKAGWQASSVVFAIRCEERVGQASRLPTVGQASSLPRQAGSLPHLNSSSTRDDDPAIWNGDVVELEIATESHSYYQIAISPVGHVVDLDRGAPKGQWFGWDSKAEVATYVADDHWTVEIRLPVTQDENDPLHQVVGRKPTQSLPWHINICRQRIRDDGAEYSALSPTGTAGFHEPLKFAHFYDGRAHRFDFDPDVTDFALGFRAAVQQRQAEPFLALAQGKVSDLQKAASLEQAARYDKAGAPAIIEQIPIDAVKKTAQMQHLLATFKASQVVAQFADEDLTKWPFWKRGDGYHARGRAYFITKDGEKAEADLTAALDWTSEPRTRDTIHLALAQNREHNLHDDDAALAAYDAIVDGRQQIGGADEFAALQGIARILTRQGRFDEALAILNRANPDKLQGTWRERILQSIDSVQQAKKEGTPP
ncbi:MAG: DUF4838 domain-containing protein [Planctomycetia bacterium]|nr:DUF4838 domain-containing protein [Planctomycetia bacterium]